jgi:hypothetical protein
MANALYRGAQRALQDRFATRNLADTVSDVIVHDKLSNDDKAFIGSRGFFFLSSVNDAGSPTVSYKDGAPGFVRAVDDKTLAFPSYDGNGMFLSMGSCVCQDRRAVHRFRMAAPDAGAGERQPECRCGPTDGVSGGTACGEGRDPADLHQLPSLHTPHEPG